MVIRGNFIPKLSSALIQAKLLVVGSAVKIPCTILQCNANKNKSVKKTLHFYLRRRITWTIIINNE
jgi:hypothetical protein